MVEEESQPQQFPQKETKPQGSRARGVVRNAGGRRPARVRALGRAGGAPVGQPLPFCCRTSSWVCVRFQKSRALYFMSFTNFRCSIETSGRGSWNSVLRVRSVTARAT